MSEQNQQLETIKELLPTMTLAEKRQLLADLNEQLGLKPLRPVITARGVYESYPHSIWLPFDPPEPTEGLFEFTQQLARQDCEDILFLFIVRELEEHAGGGLREQFAALTVAIADLQTVRDNLQARYGSP